MCQYANVPMCQCDNVPMCQCYNVPMCQYANVIMCQCANVIMCRLEDIDFEGFDFDCNLFQEACSFAAIEGAVVVGKT
jgi:hypothetical protein